MHASAFSPSAGAIMWVSAMTARDALRPLVGERRIPKHDVYNLDDRSEMWEGRCSAQVKAAG